MNLNYTNKIILCVFAVIMQFYFPTIFMGGFHLTPDILLIFITYIAMDENKKIIMIFGFILGLMQDLVTQTDLMGAFTFSKTLIAYCISYLYDYRKIWTREIKFIFIFSMYLLSFLISAYFVLDRSISFINILIYYSLVQSILSFALFYLVNRVILIDNKIVH